MFLGRPHCPWLLLPSVKGVSALRSFLLLWTVASVWSLQSFELGLERTCFTFYWTTKQNFLIGLNSWITSPEPVWAPWRLCPPSSSDLLGLWG